VVAQEYTRENADVIAVWSAFDHRFISGGEEPYESCLTCGAMFQLLAFKDDPSRGEYMSGSGDQPMRCTGDTSMVHGYERNCDNCDDNGCEHCNHDCNCCLCA